jgi:glutamyl endopeptidase
VRRPWTRALAAAALAAVLLTVATPATGEPPAEGAPPVVTALSPSGPIEPVSGVSGHRPTAAPDVAPADTVSEEPDGTPLGTESIIGRDDRERVASTTTYPNGAVGQIEVTWRAENGSGVSGLCTGSLIDDNSVLAAGHCAYLLNTRYGPRPHLIESGTFTPGRDRFVDPFGSCDIEAAWAPPPYAVEGDITYDFSVLNLAPGCDAIGTETGTFGLFARPGQMALVKANVQGYPGDVQTTAVPGTQKRDHGKIVRSQKRLVFYPMDTTGGQSGGPVWRQRTAGVCIGPCTMAVHAYGTDPQSTGVWHDNNAGMRLTPFRIGQILDIAAQND